jgi:hypothetical protein
MIHIAISYHRFLLASLTSRVSRNKVRIVFGARQTGKAELLRRVVPAEPTTFFDLAETAVRRRFETDPAAFGREVRALPARQSLSKRVLAVPWDTF